MAMRKMLVGAVAAACSSFTWASAVPLASWWWHGQDAADPAAYTPKLDFLVANGVTEIYFGVDSKTSDATVMAFVRTVRQRGITVQWLSGDVSWIWPGALGFDEVCRRFVRYQRKAPADAKFDALHLDVEPHQDAKLSDARKWQLYADFVCRAAALVHRAGEKIEWDIPFWLDNLKVDYDHRTEVPLLEVVMGLSDGVTLMSYRDKAEAILELGRMELELAGKYNCRVAFGAETGETGEGDFVSFAEEGSAFMLGELGKLRAELAKIPTLKGKGVAVHHVGSWMKLAK
ncbi:MAG: hypothetical protein ACI4RD_10190 [Kiritimatiellia bacterium]